MTIVQPHLLVNAVERPIHFTFDGGRVIREVHVPIGSSTASIEPVVDTGDPERDWMLSWLRGREPKYEQRARGRVRTVDLFSGTGGLALGTRLAIEAIGRRHSPLLAADMDPSAIDVHDFNFGPRRAYLGSVRELFDPTRLDAVEDATKVPHSAVLGADWLPALGEADVVVGGPPCQGHSNLNNRTRRTDARNELYRWMALAAHGLRAKIVIIENVPSVKSDAGDVVRRTIDLLRRIGYVVTFDDVVAADRVGVAQTRRRHFLVAIRSDVLSPDWLVAATWMQASTPLPLSALDAIADLQDIDGDTEYDRPAKLSMDNRARVAFLHDHDVHRLPDELRPECHRDGNHTYDAVYGRMFADQPAPTLSTGFLSPGRGRYVHPTRPRTLTPHEGARLQGFPDGYRFVGASGKVPTRTVVARLIGDAVPPPLAFHVALGALGMLSPGALE